MAKGKVKTIAIKLVSTAGTGFFYATTKNPRNVTRKLALKKVSKCIYHSNASVHIYTQILVLCISQYDPVVRQHVVFTESKMK